MWIKICGNTNLEDAKLAAELGADALGFIFAPSGRRVYREQAADIIAKLPTSVETVGVFTDPNIGDILDTVREARLSAVQLHVPLNPELLTRLDAAFDGCIKLIQVVTWEAAPGADTSTATADLQAALKRPELFAVLLDAAVDGRSGGLGVPFAWADAAAMVRATGKHPQPASVAATKVSEPHLILAGGLRPENVREAIATLQPWGVDVVSGVEESPGRKDPEKLQAFVQAAQTDLAKSVYRVEG